MTDGNASKKASIPAWQIASQKIAATESAPDQNHSHANTSSDSTREDVIEHSKEFLRHEDIRSASREEKKIFLEKKGLRPEEVDELLKAEETDQSELKTVHDTASTAEEKSTPHTEDKNPQTSVTKPPSSREQVPDGPPIITYPEFLLKPQKPPPLITIGRLVNAAYGFAAISAVTWSASKYLIDPMLQTLSEARHDLAETTLQDIEKLNHKLETSVSHVPYIASAAAFKNKHESTSDDDVESIDSDPTELFHRDIATQTTPSLSRSPSTTQISDLADPAASQASKLASLHAQLAGLSASQSIASNTSSRVSETLRAFQTKIDDLQSSYNFVSLSTPNYMNVTSSSNKDKTGTAGQANSEIMKFKAEIRTLKGAFLSSRNFAAVPRSISPAPGSYGAS